ncbi:hypothetical protein DPMN_075277 [Dreissena polymorpha]|uniref:Uncharacterized protein n=1 Tax=Dreissena polymorpha TaxID=45954 RepID=A0A9D3YGV7_DREPO|nr:hypothetical protein DPMN_075277 [Dreissena polymorpha]
MPAVFFAEENYVRDGLTRRSSRIGETPTSVAIPPKNAFANVCGICHRRSMYYVTEDIIGTNLLTNHWTRTINVASRVLTRNNAPPPGGHVFQLTQTIFKLVQDIIRMNLLTKFHEDRTINVASRVLTRKNASPAGGHVFQATGTIFIHVQDIIGTNLMTKFHDDRTINVASIGSILGKMPLHLGGHVFQPTGTIFKLIQDIIGTIF